MTSLALVESAFGSYYYWPSTQAAFEIQENLIEPLPKPCIGNNFLFVRDCNFLRNLSTQVHWLSKRLTP